MPLSLRHQQIIELLSQKKKASVRFLSEKLYVCEMTIRRDLAELEKSGHLKRYHGGAVISETDSDLPISVRIHINEKEKKKVAEIAKRYLKDNQFVYLDSSSTCAYLLPYFKEHKNITVVTNSILFLSILSKYGINCKLTGGDYLPSEKCLVGRDTENYLRGINVDIAFLSCNGMNKNGMISDDTPEWAEISKIMKNNSRYCIILMDKTKMNTTYPYNVFHKDEADEIIIV